MYMIDSDRNKLINTISGYGADAVTALSEGGDGRGDRAEW